MMPEKLRRGLRAFLVVVFIVAAVFLGRSLWEYHQGEEIYESAKEFVTEEEPLEIPQEPENTEEVTVKEEKKTIITAPVSKVKRTYTNIDFSGLRSINEDVIGWIQIFGTQIDYPLLLASDNQYYLNHTYDGRRSSYGSIFLEPANRSDLRDRHVVIYGHNMVNKSMFGSLMAYKQQSYADAHPTITICLPGRDLTYQIFSAYTAHINSAAYQIGFSGDASFQKMIAEMKANSMIQSSIVPDAGEQILTLSTCTPAGAKEYRFVVHAVLVSGNQPEASETIVEDISNVEESAAMPSEENMAVSIENNISGEIDTAEEQMDTIAQEDTTE